MSKATCSSALVVDGPRAPSVDGLRPPGRSLSVPQGLTARRSLSSSLVGRSRPVIRLVGRRELSPVELVADAELAVVPPVQRIVSSPSGLDLVERDAASRNSSSRARNRATMTTVMSASATSERKISVRSRAQPLDHDAPPARARSRRARAGGPARPSAPRGAIARAARAASCSGVIPKTSSGSSAASCGSSPACVAASAGPSAIRSANGGRDVLERAVLQQPGEQQVARLDAARGPPRPARRLRAAAGRP